MHLIYFILIFAISCSNEINIEPEKSSNSSSTTATEVTEIPKSFYLTSTSMPLSFGPEVFTSANDEANTKTFSIADTSKEYFLYVEASEDMEYERARFKILLNGEKVRVKHIKKGKIKIRPVQLLDENTLEVRVKSKREKSIKISIASSDSLTPVFGPVTITKVNKDLNTKYRGNNRKDFLTQKFEFDLSDPVSEAYLVLESKSNAKAKVTLKLNGEKIIGKRKLSLNRREKIIKLVSLQELNTIEVITRGKGEFELSILRSEDNTLPPDPGEEGEKTLLGIDSDNDGLRDDLQRWIYLTYPEKPELQLALSQLAKDYTESYKFLDNKDAAIENDEKVSKSQQCASYVFDLYYSESDQFFDLFLEIENTLDRFLAARKIDSYFSGTVFDISDNDLQHCNFSTNSSLTLTQENENIHDKPGTDIFYINGILTSRISAKESVELLENLADKIDTEIDNKIDPGFDNYRVQLLYQEAPEPGGYWNAFAAIPQILEAYGQKKLLIYLHNLAYGRGKTTNIFEQYWYNFHKEKSNYEDYKEDLEFQIEHYVKSITEGRRIIVTAHSQGTLFANLGYSELFILRKIEPEVQKSIGLNFIGPAANHIADRYKLYAKFSDDILTWFPWSLPYNIEPANWPGDLVGYKAHSSTSYLSAGDDGRTWGYNAVKDNIKLLSSGLKYPLKIAGMAVQYVSTAPINIVTSDTENEFMEPLEVSPGNTVLLATRGLNGAKLKIEGPVGFDFELEYERVELPVEHDLSKKAYQVYKITIPKNIPPIEAKFVAEHENVQSPFRSLRKIKIRNVNAIFSSVYLLSNNFWDWDQTTFKDYLADYGTDNIEYGSTNIFPTESRELHYISRGSASSNFGDNLRLNVSSELSFDQTDEEDDSSVGIDISAAAIDRISVIGGDFDINNINHQVLKLYFDITPTLSGPNFEKTRFSRAIYFFEDGDGGFCQRHVFNSWGPHELHKDRTVEFEGVINTEECVITISPGEEFYLDLIASSSIDLSRSEKFSGRNGIFIAGAEVILKKITFADGVTTPESIGAKLYFDSGTISPNSGL